MNIYLEGKKIRISPAMSIGKGGEADVYNIGQGRALKIFKPPDHIDYAHSKEEQLGARERIKTHQKKLKFFPKNLPQRVISPKHLATNKSGVKIVGYDMRFLSGVESLIRYSEKSFRNLGVDNEIVVKIFMDLHRTVKRIHEAQAIIGDFNDLNVLIDGDKAYIIDADSFQFGQFLCKMFTQKFLDPVLDNSNVKEFILAKPYNVNSDWYSFAVMLWQTLLFVNPFGGIYKPKNKKDKILQGERAKKRISLFNIDVRYPKSAIHFKILPDDLLQYFFQVFEKDKREQFPMKFLQNLHFCKCSICGVEHARGRCPDCNNFVDPVIKEVVEVVGKITATRIFWNKGLILFAKEEGGELKWLYHSHNQFKREGDKDILRGELDLKIRYRILRDKILLAKNNHLIIVGPNQSENQVVDSFRSLPMFDANSQNYFWIQNGQLLKNGKFGSEYIGDVLINQTLFWVGEKFGFGFYMAGYLNVAFVFSTQRKGINDNINLPLLRGQLIDSTCFFGGNYCWFFVVMFEKGRVFHYLIVLNQKGEVISEYREEKGQSDWLHNIRGKCAVSNFLLSATDDGIVRLDIENGVLRLSKRFPDTVKYVDENCHLFPGSKGLYVVNAREIYNLKFN